MKRTQIQLPDELFERAHHLADRKEISMAELVRRGLEYLLAVSPNPESAEKWRLPGAVDLKAGDPFSLEDWRSNLHMDRLKAAEPRESYGNGEAP